MFYYQAYLHHSGAVSQQHSNGCYKQHSEGLPTPSRQSHLFSLHPHAVSSGLPPSHRCLQPARTMLFLVSQNFFLNGREVDYISIVRRYASLLFLEILAIEKVCVDESACFNEIPKSPN